MTSTVLAISAPLTELIVVLPKWPLWRLGL
jgi:hypothetical protein